MNKYLIRSDFEVNVEQYQHLVCNTLYSKAQTIAIA